MRVTAIDVSRSKNNPTVLNSQVIVASTKLPELATQAKMLALALQKKHKIDALLGMAVVNQMQENFQNAANYLNKAQELSQEIYGLNNKTTAKIIYQQGLLSQAMNNPDMAQKYFEKTLEIQSLVLPPFHPDLALTQQKIKK